MRRPERSRVALVAGALYVVLGVLFLLDRLGVITIAAAYVLPVLLIALGVGVILGSRRSDTRPPPPAPAPETDPPPPPASDAEPPPATDASA